MKALSPVMIMLATAQVMRSVESLSKKYTPIAAMLLDEVLHGGYITERGILESVSGDGKFVDSPAGRTVNPGHSLEAAWFILSEAIITENEEALSCARHIIDVTLPLGLDKKNGGIIAFTDICGKPPVALEWDMKLWWPQCEAVVAYRMLYKIYGEEKYLVRSLRMEKDALKAFADFENGEWYCEITHDGKPISKNKGSVIKGPFHIPRMLFALISLEENGDIMKYIG